MRNASAQRRVLRGTSFSRSRGNVVRGRRVATALRVSLFYASYSKAQAFSRGSRHPDSGLRGCVRHVGSARAFNCAIATAANESVPKTCPQDPPANQPTSDKTTESAALQELREAL
jgi:hypothetical protein